MSDTPAPVPAPEPQPEPTAPAMTNEALLKIQDRIRLRQPVTDDELMAALDFVRQGRIAAASRKGASKPAAPPKEPRAKKSSTELIQQLFG